MKTSTAAPTGSIDASLQPATAATGFKSYQRAGACTAVPNASCSGRGDADDGAGAPGWRPLNSAARTRAYTPPPPPALPPPNDAAVARRYDPGPPAVASMTLPVAPAAAATVAAPALLAVAGGGVGT